MVRASARERAEPQRQVLSPGLAEAPVLDLLSSHFVLTLALRSSGRFNLRRDWNSLLAIVGRHLVWTVPVLTRVRAYLRERGVGRVVVKKRGTAVEPDALRRRLDLHGPHEAVLVLTRLAGAQTVIVVEPVG